MVAKNCMLEQLGSKDIPCDLDFFRRPHSLQRSLFGQVVSFLGGFECIS